MIETVNGAAAPFVTGRLAGTAQAAPNGTPEQVKVSVPVKPADGVACKLNWAG